MVIAFGAGSGNDLTARELVTHMSSTLGQSVVAKAAPDGYVIGLSTSSELLMNPGLYKSRTDGTTCVHTPVGTPAESLL